MTDTQESARLQLVFRGDKADRTPILGGWIACPEHIASITGVTLERYWEDPCDATIRAYKKLGTDGLIDILVPVNRDDFRIVDAHSYQRAQTGDTLDDAVRRIKAMPEATEFVGSFDVEKQYKEFALYIERYQQKCGDMLFMPAQWGAGAKINWYADFGYENFFMIVGLYPDIAKKLIEVGGAMGYCKSLVIARAVKEGMYPKAVLLGEDICTQRGSMISPAFLEKFYAPQLRRGLEPLLEVGCRPVWHCDGDVRAIMDMLLDCGVQGLQGFQPECGLNWDYISRLRAKDGGKLLIFGPLSVTTEMPVLSARGVYDGTKEIIRKYSGDFDLVLFTSNTINPDVPLENILAMYQAIHG